MKTIPENKNRSPRKFNYLLTKTSTMKTKSRIPRLHFAFLLAMLMFAHHTFAQCGFANTYNSSTGWVTSGVGYTIGPASFNFNTTPCGAYNYARTLTPCTLNDSCWCADINFSYGGRSATGVAHTLLSFTSDTLNSWNNTPGFAVSNNDVIEAYVLCPAYGAANTDSIFGRSKLGTTWSAPSKGIAVLPGNRYYIRLQRLSPTQGLISVFSNSARTVQVPGSPQCFTINQNVDTLRFLQHGAIPQGAPARDMTGSLDTLVANSVNTGIKGMPSVICGKSGTVNLNVAPVCGASSYTWSGPTGFSITSGQGTPAITGIVGAGSSGTVTCNISFPGAACGITYTATIVHSSPPTLSVSASPSSTICFGSSTTLTASGTSTIYSWSPSTGLSNPNIANPIASPTVTTTYTVTGWNAAGCSRTATITVTVNPLLTANAGPNDTTCCGSIWWLGNGSATATGGTSPYSYSWSPTTNFTGCTNCPNPPVMSCTGTPGPITYTLTVTDAMGCTATSTVTIWYNYCRLANPNANQNQQGTTSTADELSVAPNPTNGNFVITLPGTGPLDVEVVDVLGKIVYSKPGISDASLTVDLSSQPKGVYFIKCREGDQVLVQRIVIQ